MIRNLLFRLRWHKRLAKHKAELTNAISWNMGMVRMRGCLWLATFHRKNSDFFKVMGEDR